MTRMITSFVRLTMYAVAALIVLTAVVVIVSRAIVPILDNHKADAEKWAGVLLGYPVKIEKVRLGWYQYQPEITLRRVSILDKDTQMSLQNIKRISVFISLPQTLIHRKPVVSGVMLSGAVVGINQAKNGEYTIRGFSFDGLTDQSTEASKITEALNWLSKQPRLILRNIDVHFSNAAQKKYDLTLADLRFENDDNQHNIIGKAILHQHIPTKVDVAVQWQGEHVDLDKLNAQVYLYISGFSVDAWKEQLPQGKNWRLDKGVVSAKIWGSWYNGGFHRLQTQFQAYNLVLHTVHDNQVHQFNRLSANLGWKQEGVLQVLAGDDILIDMPERLWPMTSFYVSAQPNETGELMPQLLKLGFVDLADLQTYCSPLLPQNIQEVAKRLAITGSVQNATIHFPATWADWRQFNIEATLAQFGVHAYQHFPGVENITADVKWRNAQGILSFKTHQGMFHLDNVFANPIDLDSLTGDVVVKIQPNNDWQVSSQHLHIQNADITADVKAAVSNTESSPLWSDISGRFTLHQAKNITTYLPLKHFDQPLNQWLKSAFFSGYVENGVAIVRGPLKDYPFDHGKGLFKISGDVKGVDFKFAPDWPMLEGVDATLVFQGRQIVIDTQKAVSAGVNLGRLHGVIPYLGDEAPQILQVDTVQPVETDFTHAFSYIHHSPLNKSLGKMFKNVEFKGPLSLTLGLTIPLKDPDQTVVKGDLNIANAEMDLVPWHLKIDQLTGLVHFTEKTTTAEVVKASLFGKPLQFSLATIQKTKALSVVRASIANQLNIADIEAWLKIPFSKVVTGTTDIRGNLDFSLDAPMDIHLVSDLVGVTVDLPGRFGKAANVKRHFVADLTIPDSQPMRAQVHYGDLFVNAMPSVNDWVISLDTPGISGSVTIPMHMTKQDVVTADFQQLRLDMSDASAPIKLDTVLGELPGIAFRARMVQVGALPLGQVVFKTSPNGKNIKIDNLTISTQETDLHATGSWADVNGAYTTQLQGVASSGNVSNLLTYYGFDVHNFIAKKGRVDFRLSWVGAPFSPSLTSLNGEASLDINKGRIVDIGETSSAKMDLGKMLSIFSLQTIPRRLSFDFSDIFQKGYSFDYLKGDFVFKNGNLLTNNTRFEGPVARVGIDGRIGLVKKDYDLKLSVTPYITSSIPVAAALVTLNPLVGVGAYAVSKVVSSGVNKVTTHEYLVTGSWSHPSWRSSP